MNRSRRWGLSLLLAAALLVVVPVGNLAAQQVDSLLANSDTTTAETSNREVVVRIEMLPYRPPPMSMVVGQMLEAALPLSPPNERKTGRASNDTETGNDTVPVLQRPLHERVPTYTSTLEYLSSLQMRPRARRQQNRQRRLDLEMISNETLSPTGQEFFETFNELWQDPDSVAVYSIRVREEVAQGLRTQVIIELNGDVVLRLPVRPDSRAIRRLARQVSQYLRNKLQREARLLRTLGGAS